MSKLKLKKLRSSHKAIFIILGLIGTISIWRGVWNLLDTSPFVSHPIASVIIGAILIALSGLFYKIL